MSRIDTSRQASKKTLHSTYTHQQQNKTQQQNKKQLNKQVEYAKINLLSDILRTDMSTDPIIDDHKYKTHTQLSIQKNTPLPDNTNQIISLPRKNTDDTHDQIPDHSTSNT